MKKLIVLISMFFLVGGCSQIGELIQTSIDTFTTTIYGTAEVQGSNTASGISISLGKQSSSTMSLQSTSYSKVAETNNSGFFQFSVTSDSVANTNKLSIASLSFPSGIYSVKFEKKGYEPVIINNVPIVVGTGIYEIENLKLYKEYITIGNDWVDTEIVAEYAKDYYLVTILDSIPSGTIFEVNYPDSPYTPRTHDYSITQLETIGIGAQTGRMLMRLKTYEKQVRVKIRPR